MDSPRLESISIYRHALLNAPFSPAHSMLSEALSFPSPDLSLPDSPVPLPPLSLSSASEPLSIEESSSSSGPAATSPIEGTQPSPAEDIEGAQKSKKRGRKVRNVTEEQKREAHEKRVERNRHCARENRKRKKQYIFELENKVAELTVQLDMCRKRLAAYEERDKLENRYMSPQELYKKLRQDAQRFAAQRLLQFAETARAADYNLMKVVPTLKNCFEEKRTLIDMMSKITMDMSIPVPLQCMFHFAEDKDCSCEITVDENNSPTLLGSEIRRNWDKFVSIEPDTRNFFMRTAGHLRKDMSQYFSALENIKRRVAEIDLYMVERLMPRLDASFVDRMMQTMRERLCTQRLCNQVDCMAVAKFVPPLR